MAKKGTNESQPNRPQIAGYVALVVELLAQFPVRSRAILMARFGIAAEKRKTLEEIGKEYHITRERVRQVIDSVLKNLKQALAEETADNELLRAIERVLENAHGILPMTTLLNMLVGNSQAERGALTVILHSLPGVKVTKETKDRRECVILNSFSLAEWKKVLDAIEAVFTEWKDVMTLPELETALATRLPKEEGMSAEQLASYLAPSLLIGQNVFGRYGLIEWSAISPRGTRERAHLILKMLGRPLHFREMARMIDEHGLHRTGKKTHPQTVHNELIKDKRFVLVGRGTYALATWGYKKGTVREVLTEILKEGEKPMSKEELLTAVMKIRQVKKSTVVINLNTFFTKVGKNIYTLGKP